MARHPLQQGNRVTLKKHAYKHIEGSTERSAGPGSFLVHWDQPNDTNKVKTGVYKISCLQHAPSSEEEDDTYSIELVGSSIPVLHS